MHGRGKRPLKGKENGGILKTQQKFIIEDDEELFLC
jgi:hypothetical protein